METFKSLEWLMIGLILVTAVGVIIASVILAIAFPQTFAIPVVLVLALTANVLKMALRWCYEN